MELGDPRLIRAVGWFVGAGLLCYLVATFWFGWRETIGALAALGWRALLIGAVFASTAYLWRFGRWEYSLQCLGYAVPRVRHLGIYLSGLALSATPGKIGETFRSALLLQQGVRVADSLAAFLTDRASDVLAMCLLGGGAAWFVGQPLAWAWALAFAFMLLGSWGFAYLLLHPLTDAWWNWLMLHLKWLPIKGGQEMLESWAGVWKLPRVLVFSALAMLAYGSQALVFAWFCDVTGVGLLVADCVLIFVQATLFGAATMLPGGLGAMEAALVFQLIEHGVGDALAVSLAISIRLVTLWLGMSLGGVSLLSLGAGLRVQE
ncbi:lysylphosphatidylglycerol synthase transmembrane domain-containing protein [Aromatoleum petrolei]|uniref:lysylphosphatidylglycerol synthase transmembrane domain-containing protein n=1 Tax=Aromatoleum petrolei TaxID=76116 RepID=UPI001AEC4897|nr:lysylphosphatidylglycerol synthase transmembrane domain-containing protein [Aromatoleum petrolei]